jgi:hypothetical protein
MNETLEPVSKMPEGNQGASDMKESPINGY